MKQIKRKKIGIIGGVGPQATCALYSEIIRISQEKYGARNNNDYPRIVIESVPVPDFISDMKDIKVALKMLIESVRNLEQSGATIIAIGSNTVHTLLNDLKGSTNVEFLSVIDLVISEIKSRDFKKVGIVASPITLNSNIYDKKLSDNTIDVIKPQKEDYFSIEGVIRGTLAGHVSAQQKKEYRCVIEKLFNRGAAGVILSCTELPLVLDYRPFGDKIIDSIEVLARGLTDYYFN